MKFSDLRLAEPIVRAVHGEGYTTATPVQLQAIPHVLEGRDVMGCAQTGTGKTAAFALPLLDRLSRAQDRPNRARCLVLCPTRELATQIADSFRAYGKHLGVRHTIVFGGVGQNPQVQSLRRGTDIIVATPGRLLDLMNQNCVDLRGIETLVLDEADRMLDMGFIHDIRRIVERLPKQRQTLMFSATMPAEIRQLAGQLLRDPISVQVAPVASTADGIDESVYFVERRNKPALLAHLYKNLPMYRALVFTRTKHGADRVVRHLHQRGIRAEAIHGNKTQNARERALANFRSNKTPVLVATDLASRGIDIDQVSHVVNYDLTHEPETYIHRIGRTARAGATGTAISFCDHDERPNLKAIERLIRRAVPVKSDHPTYTSTDQDRVSRPAPTHVHAHAHRQSRPHVAAKPHHASRPPHHQSHAPAPAAHTGHVAHAKVHAHAPVQRAKHPLFKNNSSSNGDRPRGGLHHRRPASGRRSRVRF